MSSRPLQVSICLPAGKHQVLPINGTASDVEGIFSATKLRNTVNERSMVTPVTKISDFILSISVFCFFTDNMLQGVSYNATGSVRVPSLCDCASHCDYQSEEVFSKSVTFLLGSKLAVVMETKCTFMTDTMFSKQMKLLKQNQTLGTISSYVLRAL